MPQDPQPESSQLGEFVQEDQGETLEGEPGTDPLDAGYVPPDSLSAETKEQLSDHPGDPTLDERLAAEVPDDAPGDAEPDRSGRLISEDDRDDEGADVGVDGGAASAEEAAVHIREI